MTVDWSCPHGYPSRASCLACMEEGPVAPPVKVEADQVVRTISAKYESVCPRCKDPIGVDDVIHLLEPSGVWVHRGCE